MGYRLSWPMCRCKKYRQAIGRLWIDCSSTYTPTHPPPTPALRMDPHATKIYSFVYKPYWMSGSRVACSSPPTSIGFCLADISSVSFPFRCWARKLEKNEKLIKIASHLQMKAFCESLINLRIPTWYVMRSTTHASFERAKKKKSISCGHLLIPDDGSVELLWTWSAQIFFLLFLWKSFVLRKLKSWSNFSHLQISYLNPYGLDSPMLS